MSEVEATKERLTALLGVGEIASLLGLDASAVSHKLAGRRPWKLEEAQIIAAHVREHFDPTATVDQLFGQGAAA